MKKSLEIKNIKEKVKSYMNLPYSIRLIPEEAGGYFVEVEELPGCMTDVEKPKEILPMIREAMESWLEVAIEKGIKIPEPKSMEEYSGKFIVRLPKYLHAKLAKAAERENTSLNQFVSDLLSEKVTIYEIKALITEELEKPVRIEEQPVVKYYHEISPHTFKSYTTKKPFYKTMVQ